MGCRWPGGESFVLEPDLSYTVTILIIVATINAVNFIDGLDGLAASRRRDRRACVLHLVYSYTLTHSVGIPSQSVPAVVSAVLAGICIGFLPHNFNPARIFMGDTGSMLLGLLLAYGPISSAATLDSNILVHYTGSEPLNRFPTILPLIIPVAIWLIPYTDLLLAVVRRMAAGQSPFAADRQHLHHRLQNMGHSHRQTVLLMYLWAALFSGTVVGLSVVGIGLVWFAIITLAAIGALVVATAPKLRPWHSTGSGKRARTRETRDRSDDVTCRPRAWPHRLAGRYPASGRLSPRISPRRRRGGYRRPHQPWSGRPEQVLRERTAQPVVRTGSCSALHRTLLWWGRGWRSAVNVL